MAAIYQNQTNQDIIVPTADGTMSLYPYEYVGGSYYAHVEELTDVTAENIDEDLVKYWFPGSEPSGGGGGTITSIVGVSPINASEVDGAATISIDPLTADDIGPGEVVKSINGITDAITITNGAGITVDTTTDTITINNTQLGLTDTYATPPLYLTLGEGNVSLEGSIAITPTDDGGAVALQTGIPAYQDDFAALRSIFLKSAEDTDPFLRVYSTTDTLLTSLDSEGIFYTQDVVANTVDSTLFHVHETIAYDGTDYTVGNSRALLQSSSLGSSYFDLPFNVLDTITLGPSSVTPGNIGNILGLQQIAYVDPFIDLYTIPNQTTPLIRLNSGYTSGTPNTNVYLDIVDSEGESLIKMHGDGIITAKTVEADTVDATTVNATTIFAENLYTATVEVVGPDTLNITTSGGPETVIANCSAGPVVVQLPDLDGFEHSLKVTVLKIDTSNNALSIVRGPNSLINGSTLAVNITSQYAGKTLVSSGMNWYITNSVG